MVEKQENEQKDFLLSLPSPEQGERMESDSQKILILGAGIAGLSAAHRLCKLGLGAKVHIYEKNAEIGGLARTIRVPLPASPLIDSETKHSRPPRSSRQQAEGHPPSSSSSSSSSGAGPQEEGKAQSEATTQTSNGTHQTLVTEHSWRIYGTGYYTLRQMMKEIPHLPPLVTIRNEHIFFYSHGKQTKLPLPQKVYQWLWHDVPGTQKEKLKLLWQLLKYLCYSDERLEELKELTWASQMDQIFTESPEARNLMVGWWVGQVMGEDPEKCSASSIFEIFESMLFDLEHSFEFGLTDGPTNEAFLNHWRTYLESEGVTFHMQIEIVEWEPKSNSIRLKWLGDPEQSSSPLAVHPLAHTLRGATIICALDPANTARLTRDSQLQTLAGITRQESASLQMYFREPPVFDQFGIICLPQTPYQILIEPMSKIYRPEYKACGPYVEGWSMALCDPYARGSKTGKTFLESTEEEIVEETIHQLQHDMGGMPERSKLAQTLVWPGLRREPKTSCNAQSWKYRPEVGHFGPKFLLAGDYVRNGGLELTRMESASRSGFQAANVAAGLDKETEMIQYTRPTPPCSICIYLVRIFDGICYSCSQTWRSLTGAHGGS